MLAITLTSPPHSLHVSISISPKGAYSWQTHVSSAGPKSLLHGAVLGFGLNCRLLLWFFCLCLVWRASPLPDTYYSARRLANFARSDLNIGRIQLDFLPILEPGTRSAIPLPKWEQQVSVVVDCFLHSNNLDGRLGEARQSGNIRSAIRSADTHASQC